MHCTHLRDGTITKDYQKILKVQYDFYRDLYTKDRNVHFSNMNTHHPKISMETSTLFECFVSKDELFDALMTLKSGKVPGLDGLTLAFYRKFWKDLVDPLHEMLKQAFDEGELSNSARKGIINLIPKANQDETYMKNWQPITLLCYDYKIYAKALANRMDTVMEEIVPKHQTGFVRGRTIMSNLTKTREIISYLNKAKCPGVIAIVDYEKCFDKMDINSIGGALRYLGYGENFGKMVMLYTQTFCFVLKTEVFYPNSL